MKTHDIFRPIKLHKFKFIYVPDVLHQGSVLEVWWIVICNVESKLEIMVFIVICHSYLFMHYRQLHYLSLNVRSHNDETKRKFAFRLITFSEFLTKPVFSRANKNIM